MARTKKTEPTEVQGRALVDIPQHGLLSGDYASLPADVAEALEKVGMFDTKAKQTEA